MTKILVWRGSLCHVLRDVARLRYLLQSQCDEPIAPRLVGCHWSQDQLPNPLKSLCQRGTQ
jgi:hypothetical protein